MPTFPIPMLSLPSGTPYDNWGDYAALIIGAIEDSLSDEEQWEASSQPDVSSTLTELAYILPLLSACVAALQVTPLKFFVVRHKETANTDGGSVSATSHNKHALNEEIYDPDSLVTLSSGNAIVVAGNYLLIGIGAVYKGNLCYASIYDVTSATRIATGIGQYASSADSDHQNCMVVHGVVFAASHEIELDVYTQSAQSGNGLGNHVGASPETYAYLIGLQL